MSILRPMKGDVMYESCLGTLEDWGIKAWDRNEPSGLFPRMEILIMDWDDAGALLLALQEVYENGPSPFEDVAIQPFEVLVGDLEGLQAMATPYGVSVTLESDKDEQRLLEALKKKRLIHMKGLDHGS